MGPLIFDISNIITDNPVKPDSTAADFGTVLCGVL